MYHLIGTKTLEQNKDYKKKMQKKRLHFEPNLFAYLLFFIKSRDIESMLKNTSRVLLGMTDLKIEKIRLFWK